MDIFLHTDDPEADAADVLSKVWGRDGRRTALPVDPFAIARDIGIPVYEASLDLGVSGMLVKDAGQMPVMYLQRDDPRNRQRFTCAHEIGHWVRRSALDSSWEYVERRSLLTSQGVDPEEIYANGFAAALLMPADEVRDRFRETPNMGVLARAFGVSVDAMSYRVTNLRATAA